MSDRPHIVADANIPALDETFGRHGAVRRVDGRKLDRADLVRAEVLLVRSVTRVNAALLENTPVRFVGSATIGTDHLDTRWLERKGIAWASAPGCNAEAAAQYTLAMMLLACRRLGHDLRRQSVGIVGRGNVGSRLQGILDALGVANVACDPPLAAAGEPGLVGFDEALAQDIVSLHVPLTRSGRWPTRHMLDEDRLAAMKRGALLVNAARGDVVDGTAVLAALRQGSLHAAFDTWPDEPGLDPALLAACTVATPHVAGYSLEGRLRGTGMIHDAWCRHAGIGPADRGALPWPEPERLVRPRGGGLEDLLLAASNVEADDAALRALAGSDSIAADFDALRRDYRWRRDWSGIMVVNPDPGTADTVARLGFRTET